jgi:aminopeptidase-like protein
MPDTGRDSLLGQRMYNLARELYPLCRSITGDGVRQTLQILREIVPIQIFEIPSGTPVFDWTIPKEWNIREAWIKDAGGQKIVDFKDNNLHILNYSIPYNGAVMLDELKSHLHTLPDKPDLVPYRTSYYQEQWGFCMSHNQMEELSEGLYEVFIDSSLTVGSLTYGELLIPGETKNEFLFSTHICHPSLANDNLSGITLLTYLASILL